MDGTVRGVGIASADAMMTLPRSAGRYDMAEVPVMDEGLPMPLSGHPAPSPSCSTAPSPSRALSDVARRVDQAAAKDNQRLATTKQQVHRWRARRFLSRRSCGG